MFFLSVIVGLEPIENRSSGSIVFLVFSVCIFFNLFCRNVFMLFLWMFLNNVWITSFSRFSFWRRRTSWSVSVARPRKGRTKWSWTKLNREFYCYIIKTQFCWEKEMGGINNRLIIQKLSKYKKESRDLSWHRNLRLDWKETFLILQGYRVWWTCRQKVVPFFP